MYCDEIQGCIKNSFQVAVSKEWPHCDPCDTWFDLHR